MRKEYCAAKVPKGHINRGTNTIKAIAKAPIAANNTAPAATSFTLPVSGWYSVEIRSLSNSILVLMASVTHTPIIAKTNSPHSIRVTLQ